MVEEHDLAELRRAVGRASAIDRRRHRLRGRLRSLSAPDDEQGSYGGGWRQKSSGIAEPHACSVVLSLWLEHGYQLIFRQPYRRLRSIAIWPKPWERESATTGCSRWRTDWTKT
jgi:hypothetical protein